MRINESVAKKFPKRYKISVIIEDDLVVLSFKKKKENKWNIGPSNPKI